MLFGFFRFVFIYSPLLYLAHLTTAYTIVGPVRPALTINVIERKSEGDPGAFFGGLRGPRPTSTNERSHICRHPAGTATVDGRVGVLPCENRRESIDARFGKGVRAHGLAEA